MQNLHLECLYPSLKGNGWCDQMNNVPECYFDGGDCLKTSTYPPKHPPFWNWSPEPWTWDPWTWIPTTSTTSSSVSTKTTTSSSKR